MPRRHRKRIPTGLGGGRSNYRHDIEDAERAERENERKERIKRRAHLASTPAAKKVRERLAKKGHRLP